MNDLTMTNVWLGILAVISLIEFLMIALVGLMAYKAYRQMMTVVENVERMQGKDSWVGTGRHSYQLPLEAGSS